MPADEPSRPDAEPVQWLVPGFINAHCHLEYSWLGATGQPHLPRGEVPFGEWMQAIMAARPGSPEDVEKRMAAMVDGAQAMRRGGCTAVIDSTTDGSSAQPLARAGMRHFLFHEVLGLSRERAEPLWRDAMEQLRHDTAPEPSPWLIARGINPHAPYSVGPWLRGRLLSEEAMDFPQAWHLGETLDEDDLFLRGQGSIAEFLNTRGMALPYFSDKSEKSENKAPELSSFQFLKRENQLGRCQLAFHGNTLSHREPAFFSGDRALIHCPATHRWFRRSPAPLREWLDAGVNVCLGTDSLASSETLSMLEIVRMTLDDNPELSADDVLQMACGNPAKIFFMREAGITGLITKGGIADFVGLEMLGSQDSWRDALTRRDAQIRQVWTAGVC